VRIVISALHFEWDSLERCLSRAGEEFGLDGVEMSFHHCMVRPHCTGEDMERVRALAEDAGLALSAHIWENLAELGPMRGEQQLLDWVKVCEKTGVANLVIHGGSYPDRKEGLERVRELLGRVMVRFERSGVALNLENHYPYDYEGCQELFSEPWEFIDLFEALDSPALKFCLDTGHGNMAGNNVELVRGLHRHLAYVHLADNHGEHDDHCPYEEGTVDWEGVFSALLDEGFDGTFCIEFPVRAERRPFERCVRELRKRFGNRAAQR